MLTSTDRTCLLILSTQPQYRCVTHRRVLSSGISIMTKDIPGVGPMRLRYPIMPIHDYGNVIHKEVNALADMTLKKHKYERLYPDVRLDNGTIEEVESH